MAYTIYKKNGQERLAVIDESLQPNAGRFVEPQLEYSGTWMGECFITVNIKSPVPIKFAIGDYVLYRGEKFVINYDPSVIKKATKKSTGDAFCYDNVKFNALLYELSDMRMLDYVIGDNNVHYSGLPKFSVFCEDVDDFVDRLQVNADRYCEANGIQESEKWIFVTPDADRTNARGDRASSAYSEAYPGGAYTDDERFRQNVSIDNMSVWDSMKYIKETFGLSFVVRGRTVIVASAAIQAEGVFEYGKGKGLYEIERVAGSEQQIVTKLYAYGSSKNMPDRYYADMTGSPLPNNLAVDVLMLPGFPLMSLYEWVVQAADQGGGGGTAIDANAGKASITINGTTYTAYFSKDPHNPWIMSVNADDLGIREATKYFDGSDSTDEIFPTIENTGVDEVVRATVIEDNGVFADGAEIDNFKIYLPSLGFTLSDYITAEAVISMKDGFCGGREFPIVSATTIEENSTTLWEVGCQRIKDDGTKLYYPYSDAAAHGETPSATEPYQVCAGDKYVLTGITMPDTYIKSSSVKLLEASLYFLSKNDTTRYTFVPKVDEIFMARQQQEVEEGEGDAYHDIIKEGDVVIFQDIDLLGDDGQGNPNALSITIDTLRIKEYGNASIPTYDITLRQEKQVGTIQRIQEQIGKIVSGETSVMAGGGGSVNIPVVRQLIETYGANYFLKRNADDSTTGWLRFLANGGIKFGDRNNYYINSNGEAVLDNLNVQNLNALNAHFAQLIIDEIKSVGGMVIISPSNAKIHKVEIVGAGRNESYRIYFKATDGDRKVYQSFMENDQIVCAQFNAAASGYTLEDVSNKFYWRRVWRTSPPTLPFTVDGVDCHWIDVYTQGNYLGSGVPQVGDEIAVLGNSGTSADQVKRQNAIVISAYDIDWLDTGHGNSGDQDYVPKLRAPFIVQYTGINNFTLYNKRQNVISNGLNEFHGDFKANTGEDLMDIISHIEEGRLSFTHQAWASNAVEDTDPTSPTYQGWTLTDFNLAYFSGAKYMCFLSDHTEGEAHLNETIFSSAPDPQANPPVPKKNWMPVDFEIISEDYTYAITNNGNKPADSAFIYTESNLPTLQKGQYLWIKCDLEYSNGLTSTSYSVSNIGEDGEAGIDGVGSYLYIAYATSADGSQGFSKTDTGGKTYIGVYRGILLHPNDIPEDPDDYTIYKWSRYVGDAGLNGLSAPPAYKETTVPHYLVYASGTGVTKNTSGWVDNTAPALTDEKPYLWRYDTTTYEAVGGVENLLLDSTNQFNYYAQNGSYIAKIKLSRNLVNGRTYSLVFKAENLSTYSITSCSIDIYFTTSWTPPGKSSASRHTFQATNIKQEADGTVRATFTAVTDVDTNKQLAVYITGTGLSGGVPEIYWAILTDGGVQYDWAAAPADLTRETTPAVVATKGRGIGQVTEYYARNNSNTTPPSGWHTSPYTGWSTTPVTADASHLYVWNFEVITYTDGTTLSTTPHVSSGYALGISEKTVTYAVTTATTQPADSAFTYTSVPTISKGQYLWTKTEITYGDGSKSKSYSVSYKGTDGTDGEDGADGRGVTGVAIAYQAGTSGTTAPTGTWKTDIPPVAAGQYLWTRSTMSFTSGSNVVSYSVSKIGADGAQGTPGAAGADGQTTYLHIAYANSADGSVNFDTSYFTGASYIGTRTDFDIDDPNDHTKYEWAELRGMDNAGVYVTDVKNYYKVTSTNATPAIDNTWVLCPPGTIPQPTNTNRYLWNYEVTEYGCQYPNMVLNSDNPRIGGDPYIFRFDNTTNGFVHGEVYSFAMKLGQLPSPKTYYTLQIQGPSYKDGTQTATSRAISQKVGQNPSYPTRLVPNEDGIIMGTFKCNLHSSDTYGDVDHEQHIWVSAYPEGGTYDVPSFDWITVVKGTQVASWSKALSELTQTIPPHLIATQGEKGDSAWVADLTNEMDSVQCDDTGYVVSQQSVSTALSLFYGVTEKNFGTPTVKRNGSTITIGTATNGVTVTYSNKVLTIAYDTAAKITGKDEFAITITATDDSSTVRTLTFTVNGVKGDVYNLLPSFEEIRAMRDDNGGYVVSGSNIVSLTCGYTKNVNGTVTTGTTDLLDDESKTLDLEGRYNIYFRRRNRSTQSYASSGRWYRYTYATYRAYLVQTETEGVTSGGLNIDTYDAVDFVISTNTANYVANASLANVIDRETVYVVADGMVGGKGDFKATVFKRQNTKPSTPTGGTYANPVPSGWSDGIPSGGEMVWASTRIFKIDDNTTTWTEPQQMTDTMTYDVEFAYDTVDGATPATPTDDNRHGGSGTQIWFDPALDTSEDYTQMAWRAERECANGVWGDWTIIRIKGEEGDLGLSTPPELTPVLTQYWGLSSSNSTAPTTWSTSQLAPTDAQKYVWYYEKTTYTGQEVGRNMLRDSTNQWSYATRSTIYIAKMKLWEYLVAGQTYTIVICVDDLSSLSTGNLTVRTLYNSSASTKIQATVKVQSTNLYRITFTALSTTEATQVAIYIGVSNFTASSPATCPTVHWAMLTRGDVAYAWQAAPQDIVETTLPEIRTEKAETGATGPAGPAGKGIATGYPKEKFLISERNTGVTVAGNTWSDSILTPTEDKPYLWNYEETKWTDNTTTNSTPHILTTYTRAAAGESYISEVNNWYVVTALSSGVTRNNPADGTWSKTPPTPVPTNEKRYLWNYEETIWDSPEQGRNLIKSYSQSSQYTIAVCTLSTRYPLVQGATYTATIRLTVPSMKNQIRFGWYGKTTSSASNATHYITALDQSISPGLQTVTVTFTMPTFYTFASFRVYLNPSDASYEIAEIDWIKLERGALPTAYSDAPENLTTYTEPHVACIHGEDGEAYTLSPITEFASIQFTNGIDSTARSLVVGLSYQILKVVGASAEVISPSSSLYLRLKLTRNNGTTASVGHAFEDQSGNPSTSYTLNSSYTNSATSTASYTVELVRVGTTTEVLDTRVVYVAYIASAAFEVDAKLHEVRTIVQGSSFDGNGGLQNDVAEVTVQANNIQNTVQQHTTQLGEIPTTYASKSEVTQTANSINSRVVHLVGTANLLIASRNPQSGFDPSLSTTAVQEQTNNYFACFNFGNTKPGNGDTFIVSWKQTSVSGYNYRVMLYGKLPTDTYGTFLSSGNVGMETGTNGIYAYKFTITASYVVEKVVIYTSANNPTSFTPVEWAKAEFCASDAVSTNRTAWNLAIEETGSTIEQTADNILMEVQGTGINISEHRIDLNGDTQINGTLTLSNTGDGFMLRSDNGSALITPESIGSYNSFNTTTYTSSPQYHQEAGGFYKESNYYRTIPYSMYVNIGTFSSNSEIRVQNLTFSHIVLTDNYPSVTGSEDGTIEFLENGNETSYTLSSGATYSYTTSVNGASVSIRISGYFKVASGTTSYDLLDSLKSGNIVTMFGFTLRTPVQGAFVRVASDGLGVNAGNGKTAYFGPDGFHITPLLQKVNTISADYTASFTDDVIIVNNSSMVTLTLPTNGSIPEGKKIYVKKITSGNTLRVQATYGGSGMIYKCNSATAVAYEDSTSPVMTYYISFDTGSGIGWLQGYCG